MDSYEMYLKYLAGDYKEKEVRLILGKTPSRLAFDLFGETIPDGGSETDTVVVIDLAAVGAASLRDGVNAASSFFDRLTDDASDAPADVSEGKDVYSAMPDGAPGSFGRVDRERPRRRRRVGRYWT